MSQARLSLNDEAEAKASLNRAIFSLWYSDVKRDDLGMGRLKRR
jgi:hypothetical protein